MPSIFSGMALVMFVCSIQKSMGSHSLLSRLMNTNVGYMQLFQWFCDVELSMSMNTSYNNTNRLFPLPQGEGQGEGV